MVQSRRGRATAPAGGGSRSTAGRTAPANTGSHLQRGAAARKQAHHEADTAAKRGKDPWRFRMENDTSIDPKSVTEENPGGTPKNECEIIILDLDLDSIVGQYEHNIQIAGKYGNFEACPKEWDNCPICDSGDKGYYVVFFSVLVLRHWESRDGKKEGNWTKMLLPVKSAQMTKFEELCQASQKLHDGVLRGTYFYMKRDTSTSNSSNTGEPTVLEGGVMFDYYTEDDLVAEFGNAPEKSREGKLLKEQDEDITVFDYEDIFAKPDGDEMRARHGGRPQPGSQEESTQEWPEGEEPAAKRTAPPRRRPVPAAQTDATPVDEDDNTLPFDQGGDATDGRDPFDGESG